jgi:hypothetical protein
MPRYRPNLNRGFGTLLVHFANANLGQYTWRVKAVKTDGTVVSTNVTNFSDDIVDFWTPSLPNINANSAVYPILIASTGSNGTINGIEITVQKTSNSGGDAAYAESVFARGTFSPSFSFDANYTLEITSLSLTFYSGDPVE